MLGFYYKGNTEGKPVSYFLLMTTRTNKFDSNDIQGHYDHLEKLKKEELLEMYGPFSDTTGGAYLIKAASLDEAIKIGNSDPLIQNGSSTLTIKEWLLR
jgi:uncharacterized protein YciI